MKHKLKIIKLIFGIVVLIGLISLTTMHNAGRKVEKIEVQFEHPKDNYFLNDSVITRVINLDDRNVFTKSIRDIDIQVLENKVQNIPYVESVQANKDIKGVVHFKIKTNKAIARVTTPQKEYYLTENGQKMPLSKLNSATVIMVSGDVKDQELVDLSEFVNYINSSELFRKHIISIVKVGQRSYNLIVNNKNFYIELGTLNNFERKLNNLELFYDQYLNFVGTDNYEKLSLKFMNQVVATKRTKHDE